MHLQLPFTHEFTTLRCIFEKHILVWLSNAFQRRKRIRKQYVATWLNLTYNVLSIVGHGVGKVHQVIEIDGVLLCLCDFKGDSGLDPRSQLQSNSLRCYLNKKYGNDIETDGEVMLYSN